jgi:hypothetical protein
MNLYKVTIEMPWRAANYYVAASGFDAAASLAMGADTSYGENRNGGVISIELMGPVGTDPGVLLLSDDAASLLLGPNPKSSK